MSYKDKIENIYDDIRFKLHSALDLLDQEGSYYFLTIVPSQEIFASGDLERFDIKNFKRRISRHLEKTGISFAIGIIELCVKNYPDSGHNKEIWAPHAHLIVCLKYSIEKTEDILTGYYRGSFYNSGKPIDIRPIYNVQSLINYISKDPGKRGRISHWLAFGTMLTRHGRLSRSHQIELALFLENGSRACQSTLPIFARGVMRRGDNWFATPLRGG